MTTIPPPPPTPRRMGDNPASHPAPPSSSPSTAPPPPAPDRVHDLELEVVQLRTAMASRAVIEQAKGILMLLTGCTEQVAFDVLTHISSTTHRKVRDLAVAITDSACG